MFVPTTTVTDKYTRKFSPFSLAEIDDIVFGRAGRNIVLSYDKGKTHESWFTQTDSELDAIETLIAVNGNKVIAGIKSNNSLKEGYYLIEKVGSDFITRFLHPKEDEWMSVAFSQDRYPRNGTGNKIILMAEYGKQGITSFARNLYVYQEESETFKNIFKLPNFTENKTHMHGTHYDWRTDTVWVASGDGVNASNVFYSKDWRTETPTFTPVWTQGSLSFQFTSIYSTDDLILLGSDGVGDDGLYSIDKITSGEYNNPTLTKRYHLRTVSEANGLPMVGRTFLENGNGELYVIFTSKTDFPSKVLGSNNGYDWHEVFSSTESELAVSHIFSDGLLLQYDHDRTNNLLLLNVDWVNEDPSIPNVDSDQVLYGHLVTKDGTITKGRLVLNDGSFKKGDIVWGSFG